ncbi:MAG: bifunctional UDP-N-acetylmuramoyl-tripeptide:D-alanyl-D-alanine ligase/alanine racemase [Bacteroidetes bacterium]|nr:bifunctional UDP-N-acetylmuramoyl-tripeptide:D-alanyl-D-alanine ligase/alanine racemase [Bacteroidota bacterium]
MFFTIQQAASIVSAQIIGAKDHSFSQLITDSRTAGFVTEGLFIAIKGDRHNGHLYIHNLYEQGCRCFLVSEENETYYDMNEASFLLVSNTLEALQKLAAYKRDLFSIPVVGITGSNGKTIVKEWLWQLLQADYHICKNPKSYNSQLGVALSVWQLKEEDTLALFEAGISQPNEMQKLEPMIRPSIGIFTNVGSAHDENFVDKNQKITEKLALFKNTEHLFYCKDYLDLDNEIKKQKIKSKSWSFLTEADLQIKETKVQQKDTLLKAIYKNKTLQLLIPFTDKASIENSIHCWLFMLHLSYSNDVIQHRFSKIEPLSMRLEMKQGINDCLLLNDSYSNDIHSLAIALDFLQQQKKQNKIIILSDILQSGKNKTALYKEVNSLLQEKNIQHLFGIGPDILSQEAVFSMKKTFFNTTQDFMAAFKKEPLSIKNSLVLIKGARRFGFERIHQLLQQKSHDTVLEINLNHIVHNLNYYRSLLKPGVGIMPMVKAFSYGSGSFEIAAALQHTHVNYFAVAYADEGVELRKNGITTPIMVMNPEVQSFEQLQKYQLEPELFSFSILEKIAAYAQENKQNHIPVHIKLDTGMHRLGFEEKDLPKLIEKIKQYPFLQIKSIFSHLVASDDAAFDDFTKKQMALFETMSQTVARQLPYPIVRHICNSGAITRFPQAHFDMVRLGIGLYGVGANADEQKKLQHVSTLKTTISQIKKLQAGDSVGYSRKGKITKDTHIATLPIGYADGLNRKLGNGIGCLYVHGKAAPIVGNICMDMCMIDITGIEAQEGDEVIVFNSAHTLQNMAAALGTIAYEVLTSVSARVKRVYWQE